ncbi:unnamed protein product [Ilex paraguariensis]|uniref:Uncharacterized protein n=1 Tax=Ilex paraguariensis TaxID=185542 RepID=A0ABC8TJF2_9AQUA
MEGRELSQKDTESNADTSEILYKNRRSCFCTPCFGSSDRSWSTLNWWQRVRTGESEDGTLLGRGIGVLKKLREWSEIVAGPRWKTFIRRFNRNKGGGGRHANFQYDPLSYSLNFDEGQGQDGNSAEMEEDYTFRNFSMRYASVPISAGKSMDIGKEGPSFV